MNAPNIAGVCLPGAVRAWYKLRVLHMDCRSLGAEQLAEVAGCLHPTLTELRLDCPTHLGEETLAALAAALPRLDSLHLGATPHLTRLAHLSRLGALTSLGLQVPLPHLPPPSPRLATIQVVSDPLLLHALLHTSSSVPHHGCP